MFLPRTLLPCWWEGKLVQPLWETAWRFRRKLKIELPYDPAIPLVGLYLDRTMIQKYMSESGSLRDRGSQGVPECLQFM